MASVHSIPVCERLTLFVVVVVVEGFFVEEGSSIKMFLTHMKCVECIFK